jgi:hypothetical protein
MAKGDRIIAHLPPTFAAVPRPTALGSLADAFGGELGDAENSLAAMMFSHWVDIADINADALADLRAIAGLYSLAPRDDETVEGFRAHLKRYVRTFIEGTTTVRGIFRITAEALGLIIADDKLDTWWDRASGPSLTTIDTAGDDAAALLFGVASASVRGSTARPAGFLGTVDLSQPLDLRGRSLLSIAVDGAAPVTTDLATLLDAAAADLAALVRVISSVLGIAAEAHGGHLFIRTQTAGPASALALADVAGDAVPALLGIAPHEYRGTNATHARIVGTRDLPATLDLTTRRFLRLTVDDTGHEIDCAGATPAATTLAQVIAAIQAEVGAAAASADGQRLVLASPTSGLNGSVAVLAATTGDASGLLLGNAPRYARGVNAAPARVSTIVDLSAGIDLSQRSNINLAIDASAPQVIDCAGPTPTKTLAGDLATAINTAVGQPVATQNGATVTLTSLVIGAAGRIRFLTAPQRDALDLIFGFRPRSATGANATAARIAGTIDLSAGIDLSAVQRVQVAIDDATPVIVDLAAAGLGHAGVQAADIAAAINTATGAMAAGTDRGHLTLTSFAPGEQGSVAILPIETTRTRRFVSRAFVSAEASETVLGVFAAEAQGADGTPGQLLGAIDLHDGLDLSRARFLRVALDGGAPRDVDCAGGSRRPRAVLLSDMVDAINHGLGSDVASVATGRLVLTSPTTGAASAVAVLPRGGDASGMIFGTWLRTVTGSAATRITFTGLRDLSQRIDLSTANRVRLAIDGGAPVEIVCAGDTPAATSVTEIAGRINGGLGGSYASTDGKVLRIASAVAGSGSEIAFLPPSQNDATRLIFGIAPGRIYHGDDPAPAVLASAAALPTTLDLSATPYLQLAIDDGPPVGPIDCRGSTPAATTPAEVVQRINDFFTAAKPLNATTDGGHVVLTGISTGPQARIALLPVEQFDAVPVLLGMATAQPGMSATPAKLTGTVDLRQPVDLSQRSVLRISIDGGRARDIDVAGAAPDATFGDEIAAILNAAVPGLAMLDPNGHLVVVSPTAGTESQLAILPLRPIELIDYPAVPERAAPQPLASGGRFSLENAGAADSRVSLTLSSDGGFHGASLINLSSGMRLRAPGFVAPGGKLTVGETVQATPAMLTASVPFAGERPLAANLPGTRRSLVLVDPLAGNAVVLEGIADPPPTVRAAEADPATATGPSPGEPLGQLTLVGRLRAQGGGADLLDGNGSVLAHLRAGAGVAFAPFDGIMVVVEGTWYPAGAASLFVVETIARVFDVTLGGLMLSAVTIDARAGSRSLAARLAVTDGAPVIARDSAPADAFVLPRGRSDWLLQICDGAGFDAALFDVGHFAGGHCDVVGVFDVGRFNAATDADNPDDSITGERTHFAPFGASAQVTVAAAWQNHHPGAFTVNLPADLPATFGAIFNAARFTSASDTSEKYSGVVLDPPSDPDYLPTLLPKTGGLSPLVFAEAVPTVPLGWEAQTLPFAQPRKRFLTGGRADRPAAIYLREPGVAGFIAIKAKQFGAWGDEIAVSVRFAGPAMFDLTVSYAGARFECGRQIAFAGSVLADGENALPAMVADIIHPAPVGVVRAKAAGIVAGVTRDRT